VYNELLSKGAANKHGRRCGQNQAGRQQKTELQQTLAQTDHAVPSLQAQVRFIEDLQQQVHSSDRHVQDLAKRRAKELADHERYRHSTIKRFLFKATGKGDKFEEKAGKEEREYFEVIQQEHEAGKVNAQIKQQLNDALRQRGELEQTRNAHYQAQQELDKLYHDIFAGETPHFPQEDHLERTHAQALQEYHDVRARFETSSQARGLLTTASKKLEEAAQHMSNARNYSAMDVMSNTNLYDYMERSEVSQAAVLVEEAKGLVERAHVGEMPEIKIHQGNILGDLIFDSSVGDIGFHQKIGYGIEAIDRYSAALQDKIRALANEDRQALDRELRERAQYLEEARRNLQQERQRIFEQVVAGSNDNSFVSR
jgi:hypothetical protein